MVLSREASEERILSCIYDQVREEEYVIAVQFLGSEQEVSSSRMKKQVEDAPSCHSSQSLQWTLTTC